MLFTARKHTERNRQRDRKKYKDYLIKIVYHSTFPIISGSLVKKNFTRLYTNINVNAFLP